VAFVTSVNLGAVDVGASGIKFAHLSETGELRGEVERVQTPYPCTPERLLDVVATWIRNSGCDFVAIGFPGYMTNGVVDEPGNLSRFSGITSPVDSTIHSLWEGFPLEATLATLVTTPVRVVNDATLAAYGYATGEGRELVFTLGTGLGIALVVDGQVQKIRDIGALNFAGIGTYDEVFGEPARANDEALWRSRFVEAAKAFIDEFGATTVHVGGGNARHWKVKELDALGVQVIFNSNEGTLRGAATLFRQSRS
jgi:polyphosphate glucokinase